MSVGHIFAVLLIVSASAFWPGGARADAIDGEWCFSDGRNFSINGPNITTPGGNKITGDYDRHGFAYVVPQGERDEGAAIVMNLIDDDTVHVRDKAKPKNNPQVWQRCRPVS